MQAEAHIHIEDKEHKLIIKMLSTFRPLQNSQLCPRSSAHIVKKAQTFTRGEYHTYLGLSETDANVLRNKAAMVVGINGCLR